MKTQLKIIWTRFLLIGTSLVLLTSFEGCKKDIDFRVRSKWVFINDTSFEITYKPEGFWTEFNVAANSSTTIEQESEGPETVTIANFSPPLKAQYLVFNSTKCILLSEVGADKIENYINQKLDERYFEFTFTFTEEDFNNSSDCN